MTALKVLFVDDEPLVLSGLRRMTRRRRDDWEASFADGGETALAALGQDDFDVVVTDMRMPGMDGAALLEQVREQHPGLVRVVLSGHVDKDAALRATGVGHRFLAKPCEADVLASTLDDAEEFSKLLKDGRVRQLLAHLDSLPSAPTVLTDLRDCLSDPGSSAEDVAALIENDVALSTKLLQLVNSSFLGVAQEISSISQAVAYLGFEMVHTLVLSTALFRTFEASEELEGFCPDALSRHGHQAARIGMALAADAGLGKQAATAALLQDVGQLALASALPDVLATALRDARSSGRALHESEGELHGYTHADVGAYLLRLWGVPPSIAEAVRTHHRPLETHQAPTRDLAALVRVAHVLADACAPEANDPMEHLEDAVSLELAPNVPDDDLAAWKRLAADPDRKELD